MLTTKIYDKRIDLKKVKQIYGIKDDEDEEDEEKLKTHLQQLKQEKLKTQARLRQEKLETQKRLKQEELKTQARLRQEKLKESQLKQDKEVKVVSDVEDASASETNTSSTTTKANIKILSRSKKTTDINKNVKKIQNECFDVYVNECLRELKEHMKADVDEGDEPELSFSDEELSRGEQINNPPKQIIRRFPIKIENQWKKTNNNFTTQSTLLNKDDWPGIGLGKQMTKREAREARENTTRKSTSFREPEVESRYGYNKNSTYNNRYNRGSKYGYESNRYNNKYNERDRDFQYGYNEPRYSSNQYNNENDYRRNNKKINCEGRASETIIRKPFNF